MGIVPAISGRVLARSPLAILACDRQGRVLLCTPAAAKLLGADGRTVGNRCWEVAGLRAPDGSLRCRPVCTNRGSCSDPPALSLAFTPPPASAPVEILTFRDASGSIVHLLLPAARRTGRRGGLTPREQEVLGLLALGLATREIAGRLGISPITVRCHVQSLMRKMGVHHRLGAVLAELRPPPFG